MKDLESIVNQEKDQVYTQENKELFAYYTLILIGQEEGKRRFLRKLIVSGLLSPVLGLASLYFLHNFIQSVPEMLQALNILIKNNLILIYFGSLLGSAIIARKLLTKY